MHIVAVVVTHNRKESLLRCVDALRRQRGARTDILVVDNASDDGTAEALAPLMEEGAILYRNTGENLGGAGGFNFGMRLAVVKPMNTSPLPCPIKEPRRASPTLALLMTRLSCRSVRGRSVAIITMQEPLSGRDSRISF